MAHTPELGVGRAVHRQGRVAGDVLHREVAGPGERRVQHAGPPAWMSPEPCAAISSAAETSPTVQSPQPLLASTSASLGPTRPNTASPTATAARRARAR